MCEFPFAFSWKSPDGTRKSDDPQTDAQRSQKVSRRVEVDENLEPIVIPGRILNELCAHALETLPEECCGLITGDEEHRYREVARCRNDMTQQHHLDPITYPRTGAKAFFMNPRDYVEAEERASKEGGRVTAVYHSHVGAGAYLSEMDLEYAENEFFPFPESDHLVIAVVDSIVAGIGLFRRKDINTPFQGCAIVSESE
jgi:proteasome lid subunit RPN8/RPN11